MHKGTRQPQIVLGNVEVKNELGTGGSANLQQVGYFCTLEKEGSDLLSYVHGVECRSRLLSDFWCSLERFPEFA